MYKLRITLIIIAICVSSDIYAEHNIYTIDSQFRAVFPGTPQLIGEIGEGKHKSRRYDYTDEENLIVYAGTYQVGKSRFRQNDISEAIKYYVEGQASLFSGKVISFIRTKVQSYEGAIFIIDYKDYLLQKIPVRKYGIAAYKDGQFFQWTVMEFTQKSKLKAEAIFNAYSKYFEIK